MAIETKGIAIIGGAVLAVGVGLLIADKLSKPDDRGEGGPGPGGGQVVGLSGSSFERAFQRPTRS